jgi:lysophospholipase L1-like esterase
MMKKYIWIIFGLILLIGSAVAIQAEKTVSHDGEKEIVAIGDSLTYGYGDKRGEGYTGRLEEKLDKTYDENFEVENFGVYGQDTLNVKRQLNTPAVLKEVQEADTIIIFIGTNDLLHANGGDLAPLHREKLQQAEDIYRGNLEEIVRWTERNNPESPILLLGLYNPYPGNEQIGSIIEGWNEKVKAEAASHPHVSWVPTDDLFKGKKKQLYFYDSLHPNARGYDLIADRVAQEYAWLQED